MNDVSTKHGNGLVLVELDDPIAFPSSLTAWDGSTGNVILFDCLSEDGSLNTSKVDPKIYRTNDQAIRSVDVSVITGETKAKFYLQDMVTQTYMWENLLAKIAAGKTFLEYYNAGYKHGKWHEKWKIVHPVPIDSEIAGDANPIEYMSNALPQTANFVISANNITALKAVSALYAAKIHCAGPHTILANTPGVRVYT